MEPGIEDKIAYLIAVISEFAAKHTNRFYDVEHTFSFEDVVDDLTAYCHRKGGALV